MKISVLCVGKIKERFYREALAEYSKRLSRYCQFDIIEVSDEKTPDKASEALENQIKDIEGSRLLKKLPEGAYVIALCIDGTQLDSVALSEKISQITVSGINHIVFVIGGSLGLSKSIIEKADYKLSFSKLTFPHQLMRVILSEQVYRAFRIMHNEPYHK